MKITMFAAAAALAVTLSAAPALADGPRASSSNTIVQSGAQNKPARDRVRCGGWRMAVGGGRMGWTG